MTNNKIPAEINRRFMTGRPAAPLAKHEQYAVWSYVLQDMGLPPSQIEKSFIAKQRVKESKPRDLDPEMSHELFEASVKFVLDRISKRGAMTVGNYVTTNVQKIAKALSHENHWVMPAHVKEAQRRVYATHKAK